MVSYKALNTVSEGFMTDALDTLRQRNLRQVGTSPKGVSVNLACAFADIIFATEALGSHDYMSAIF